MVSLCFIGGLLLLSVGIVGEYVGKIYLESKHRPRYIIESRTPDPSENVRKGAAGGRRCREKICAAAVQKHGNSRHQKEEKLCKNRSRSEIALKNNSS